jgi:hypothetical protein
MLRNVGAPTASCAPAAVHENRSMAQIHIVYAHPSAKSFTREATRRRCHRRDGGSQSGIGLSDSRGAPGFFRSALFVFVVGNVFADSSGSSGDRRGFRHAELVHRKCRVLRPKPPRFRRLCWPMRRDVGLSDIEARSRLTRTSAGFLPPVVGSSSPAPCGHLRRPLVAEDQLIASGECEVLGRQAARAVGGDGEGVRCQVMANLSSVSGSGTVMAISVGLLRVRFGR